jgi:hypothetical protein
MFIGYMFRPHKANFRQQIIKEFTALCNLSIAPLNYLVIINFGVLGDQLFLTFLLWPLCPIGCTAVLVMCVVC